jgi:hypothetical protein
MMKSKSEEAEELEQFRTWLLRYLCEVTYQDLLVKRLRDHVAALYDYEKGFQDKVERKKPKVVQFKKPTPKLELVGERAITK